MEVRQGQQVSYRGFSRSSDRLGKALDVALAAMPRMQGLGNALRIHQLRAKQDLVADEVVGT